MQKTSNVFLGHLVERVFHIFPRVYSIMGVARGAPDTFYNSVEHKPYATTKMELFVARNRSQPETVVTDNFVLNVTGLLHPTPKCKNKFRLRQ